MTHNLDYGVSENVSFTFLICVGRREKEGILKLSTNLENPRPVYKYIFVKLVLFLDLAYLEGGYPGSSLPLQRSGYLCSKSPSTHCPGHRPQCLCSPCWPASTEIQSVNSVHSLSRACL